MVSYPGDNLASCIVWTLLFVTDYNLKWCILCCGEHISLSSVQTDNCSLHIVWKYASTYF